ELGLVNAFADLRKTKLHVSALEPARVAACGLALDAKPQAVDPSGFFSGNGVHRLLDLSRLRHRVLLVNLVQPDAGDMLAEQDAGADEQVVEVLVNDAPQQVL